MPRLRAFGGTRGLSAAWRLGEDETVEPWLPKAISGEQRTLSNSLRMSRSRQIILLNETFHSDRMTTEAGQPVRGRRVMGSLFHFEEVCADDRTAILPWPT